MTVMTASLYARDRYRWLLLMGWFVLFSGIFSFAVASPAHADAADGIALLIAMAAFIAYSAAMKRYAIALALAGATLAAALLVL